MARCFRVEGQENAALYLLGVGYNEGGDTN